MDNEIIKEVLSLGTYTISDDGRTLNYSTPAFLSKELVQKIILGIIEFQKQYKNG